MGVQYSDELYDVASNVLNKVIVIIIYGLCGARAVTCLGGLVYLQDGADSII